jgi:hypothetical protein
MVPGGSWASVVAVERRKRKRRRREGFMVFVRM